MKKVLTLVLALVFVLALAAPALAFTGDTTAPKTVPFTLKVYLVEFTDASWFGLTALPPVDRGYAKNETVAAVVELFQPKGEALNPTYLNLEISAKNAHFNVTQNLVGAAYQLRTLKDKGSDLVGDKAPFVTVGTDNNKMTRAVGAVTGGPSAGIQGGVAVGADITYKYLVFAFITADDASITAKLVEDAAPAFANNTTTFKLNGIEYKVTKIPGKSYEIEVKTALKDYTGCKVLLNINSDNKTTGMAITTVAGTSANLTAGTVIVGHGNPFVAYDTANPGVVLPADNPLYLSAQKVYDDVVVKVFGLNYDLIGAYLRDKFFEDLVSNKTIVAKVDIKPWTAYVKVPDNVVVNPPKTGAAASILGFVMVALAGASAVALKKR